MPLPEWRERYRRLIEAGASAVLGVRSDGPLGWEEYKHGVVFYGLGKLTGNSIAVSMTFERNGRFTYESRLLETADGKIGFSGDDEQKEAINAKNALLMDEVQYLDEAERACLAFYQAEGYAAAFGTNAKRGVLSGLLSKKQGDNRRIDETMLKDLLTGTSRRYAVLRALNTNERTKGGDAK
jgi:poly-gamma-glutamate synthesis protein (capsule biosynthesis protein)